MLVCLICQTPFNSNVKEINEPFTCPIRHCHGTVVDLDEMIMQTVLLLNRKGYSTVHSCAGHIDDGSGYISFERIGYDLDELDELEDENLKAELEEEDGLPSHYPEGTTQHEIVEKDRLILHWEFKTKPMTAERLKEIGEIHAKLYEWAESLKVIDLEHFNAFQELEGLTHA